MMNRKRKKQKQRKMKRGCCTCKTPVWLCGQLAEDGNGVDDWTERQEGLWKTERGVMELKAGARRVRSVTMTEYTQQRTRTIARSAAAINNTRVSWIHITRCAVPVRYRPPTVHTAVCVDRDWLEARGGGPGRPGRSGSDGGAVGRWWWCCFCGGRWCRRVGGGDAMAASSASGEKGSAADWRRPPRRQQRETVLGRRKDKDRRRMLRTVGISDFQSSRWRQTGRVQCGSIADNQCCHYHHRIVVPNTSYNIIINKAVVYNINMSCNYVLFFFIVHSFVKQLLLKKG